MHRHFSRGGAQGLPDWARLASLAWAGLFVVGGAILFAAGEMASYQKHAEGTKTVLILGYLVVVNPVASLLGGALAVGSGIAAREAKGPAWFRKTSLALGGLTLATTLLGAAGGIGLIGMGPLVLWVGIAVVAVPAWARRA